MENYKLQILYVKNEKIVKTKKISEEWKKYLSDTQITKGSNAKNVSPLVATLWNQEVFFN